tara:strand:+ start:2060 stop:2257 length:198 start_codon:yes stop_codon:yes gene_type:complete
LRLWLDDEWLAVEILLCDLIKDVNTSHKAMVIKEQLVSDVHVRTLLLKLVNLLVTKASEVANNSI